MVPPFTYQTMPSRIVFGPGSRSAVGNEIDLAGGRRALVLSTGAQRGLAKDIAESIGQRCAGLFCEAAMHVPVEVTERALASFRDAEADCIVAVGGGSTIGLGKAIAYRTGALQVVMPTTYAGSEATPILGQTENGHKTTFRDPLLLPGVVIYDPELSTSLPVRMSVASGLNALAHAVEGLYAKDRNPVTSMMAVEGIRALKSALPRIVHNPTDLAARSEALYGAWLCGTTLGTVGMSLHHKLCHTLGGSFDLPHAETHAILLPHTANYNEFAAREYLRPAAALFGGCLAAGLYELADELESPLALREIGLKRADLSRAADLAIQNAYWNPREVTREGVLKLLEDAFEGRPPN